MWLRSLFIGVLTLFSTLVLAASVEEIVADNRTIIIDVRTPQEYQQGYISGAMNIPIAALSTSLAKVPSDRPVIVYCRSGRRSAAAQQFLESKGYSNIYDGGGIDSMRTVIEHQKKPASY